jgi:hypothetical protein
MEQDARIFTFLERNPSCISLPIPAANGMNKVTAAAPVNVQSSGVPSIPSVRQEFV